MSDNKIVAFEQEVAPIIDRASGLVVNTQADVEVAVEVLSRLNKNLDAIEAEKDKVLLPLKEAMKAEKARWKPLEDMFGDAVSRIRGLLSAFQTAQVKLAKEEEEKILARTKEGKGNFTAETAIRKLGDIETPVAKVAVASGGLSFRESKVLKITNIKLIPDAYWIVDEGAVLTALKEGKVVPGAEIEVIQVPVNKR